jgi:hypothetical protein
VVPAVVLAEREDGGPQQRGRGIVPVLDQRAVSETENQIEFGGIVVAHRVGDHRACGPRTRDGGIHRPARDERRRAQRPTVRGQDPVQFVDAARSQIGIRLHFRMDRSGEECQQHLVGTVEQPEASVFEDPPVSDAPVRLVRAEPVALQVLPRVLAPPVIRRHLLQVVEAGEERPLIETTHPRRVAGAQEVEEVPSASLL